MSRSLLAFAVGALLLASPLRAVWASLGGAWMPYAVWVGLIGLAAWSSRKERDE